MGEGQYLTIKLLVNPSTGYTWQQAPTTSRQGTNGAPLVRGSSSVSFEPLTSTTRQEETQMMGAPAWQLLRFDPLQGGSTDLQLNYTGPDGTSSRQGDSFTVKINYNKH